MRVTQRITAETIAMTIDNTQLIYIKSDPDRTGLSIGEGTHPPIDVDLKVGERGEFITLPRQAQGISSIIPIGAPVITSAMWLGHQESGLLTINIGITNADDVSIISK